MRLDIMNELKELHQFALSLADSAREPAMGWFRHQPDIENKLLSGGFDPVTLADKNAEKSIRDKIEATYPLHGIRGEEFGEKSTNSPWVWVIDPIDGTRAYISGLPVWGILIALLYDGEPVLGLMDQPFTAERFIGFADDARLHHHGDVQSIKTRLCPELAQATISTTDPYLFSETEKIGFSQIREQSRLQRYGLDCYAYCALALGGVDLVLESGLQEYDIAALIPLVTAAGGQISSWSGNSAAKGGQILATGDKRLHQQALAILAPFAVS